MKIGDLVKMPSHESYWWSDQLGFVDKIEVSLGTKMYRVLVPGKGYASFHYEGWVEVVSDNRQAS